MKSVTLRMYSCLVALVLTVLFAPLAASAEAGGDEWLKKMDDAMHLVQDSHGMQTMLLIDKDGTEKKRVLESWGSGDKSLARFQEPSDVACTGFLVETAEEMYLYMPSFGKVRRIASHVRNQSFMGSDFSYNDMSRDRLLDKHEAVVAAEDETTVTLVVTPKKGMDAVYDKRTIVLDKGDFMPRLITFANKDVEVKKMTTLKVSEVNGFKVLSEMEMANLETGHKTRMLMNYDKVNQGIDQSLFSKRMLQRCK